MNEHRIKTGLSTRPVQLISGEHVRFSREALEGAATQVGFGFVPISVEHLSYPPPRGRLTRAELLTDSDGESELVMYGQDLKFLRAGEMSLGPMIAVAAEPAEPLAGVTIAAEPRNYRPDVWEEIVADAPIPVEEKPTWSGLPPLIWMLSIPVTWGAIRFAGSFFDRLGAATADRFLVWIGRAAKVAKDSGRETLIEIRFYVADGGPHILGFVPFNARDQAEIQGRAGSLLNMSSTVRPKNRAIVNARGSDGRYRPFSIKMTVWRDTPRDLASPA